MAKAGAERVQRFDIGAMLEQYGELFEEQALRKARVAA
jgi:hypothetical protein